MVSAVIPEAADSSQPETEILIRLGENWVVSSHPGVEARTGRSPVRFWTS
ncbi:MAG: hypothetical protein ACR2K6_05250 [Solirubrobacterales bacterium]